MENKDQTLDDPLGIADQPVKQDANDFHATNDPDEVAQRRARAHGKSDGEVKTGAGEFDEPGFGATSIDMGSGGKGNAIKPR